MAIVKNCELRLSTHARSSSSQLRYTHTDQDACEDWLKKFCEGLKNSGRYENFSGFLCFDFMVKNNQAFAIECNPRFHSQCCVFNEPQEQLFFARSLLGQSEDGENMSELSCGCEECKQFIQNKTTAIAFGKPVLSENVYHGWILNEIFNRIFSSYKISDKYQYKGKRFEDSDFDVEDLLPFFARNLLQPIGMLLKTFWSGNDWVKYDFCIGKVVEKNGD